MDTFNACGIIEGFTVDNPTQEQVIEAWASLIQSGACWSLQGMYGRGASAMIEAGYISHAGEINREAVNDN